MKISEYLGIPFLSEKKRIIDIKRSAKPKALDKIKKIYDKLGIVILEE